MITTNVPFDAYHALQQKTPLYYVLFDGMDYAFVNHKTADSLNQREYLVQKSFSGLKKTVTPEKGKSSISGINFSIIDYGNEMSMLISEDASNFHRKKTTIKVGYVGMDEADLITIFVGWVTGLSLSNDGTSYDFEVTDPQKWLQRKIFRSSRDTSVYLSGNPINILLAILTSTGDGTNGDYDYLAETDGLGIDEDYINISSIENIRDTWYPGDSIYFQITIDEPIRANEFIQKEIMQVINAYPTIDGQGRYNVIPFKPLLDTSPTTQDHDFDSIIGMPSFNANFDALINEIEFHYDYDGDEYQTITYYADGTSITNRGPGNDTLTIKTKGLMSSYSPSSIASRIDDIIQRRKESVFNRFSNPPIKISSKNWFSKWITEAGDICSFTHPRIPDLSTGVRGIDSEKMEIVSISPNWGKGDVSIDFLATGFGKNTYGVIGASDHVIGNDYYICP
jgi:hypothetical protein